MAGQPLVGQGILIIEATRSHSRRSTLGANPPDYWSSRRSDLYLIIHNTHKRQKAIPPDGIRTHNPSKRASTDPCLIADDHRARRLLWISAFIFMAGWMETWAYFVPNGDLGHFVPNGDLGVLCPKWRLGRTLCQMETWAYFVPNGDLGVLCAKWGLGRALCQMETWAYFVPNGDLGVLCAKWRIL
jgi:hypothetical protein